MDEDRDTLLDGLLAPSEEDNQDDEGYRLLGLVEDETPEEQPSSSGSSSPLSRRVVLALLLIAFGIVAVAVVKFIDARTVVPPEVLAAKYPKILADLRDALALNGLSGASAAFRTSPEGTTLFGLFCWDGSGSPAKWRRTLAPSMEIVTEEAAPLQDVGLRAVGVELTRCGEEDVLFWGIASLDRAIAHYMRGEGSAAAFQATWITGP